MSSRPPGPHDWAESDFPERDRPTRVWPDRSPWNHEGSPPDKLAEQNPIAPCTPQSVKRTPQSVKRTPQDRVRPDGLP